MTVSGSTMLSRLTHLLAGWACVALIAAAVLPVSSAQAQTYEADETGWNLDKLGTSMVVLRTPLRAGTRSNLVGMLLFICDRTSSKLVVSFSGASPLRAAGVVTRGSATVTVQEGGTRKSTRDTQFMAGANIMAGDSFEIVDIPSETRNAVANIARQIASGARQITLALFSDADQKRFEKDRVVRLRFPENPMTESVLSEYQIGCLQLTRPAQR
jgi:hypothetical protein